MSGPTMHPSSWQLFRRASARFLRLRAERDRASDAMWAGFLAAQFSDDEIALLSQRGFLSPRDHALLKGVGR